MPTSPELIWPIGLVVLAGAASGLAALLRWAGAPGWSVVGGAIAGIVLGPTILGRVMPQAYESAFVGGVEARRHLDVLVLHATTTPEAAAGAAASIAEAEAAWRDARWAHRGPLRGATLLATAAVLLGGTVLTRGSSPPGLATPISIGAWAALLPGAVVYFCLTAAWHHGAAPALLAAAAVAIGPWVLTRGDREAADDAEVGGAATVLASGRVASVIAMVAVAAAAWRISGPWGALPCAVLLALPAGWLRRRPAPRLARVVTLAAVPWLAALVAVHIELLAHTRLWPAVLFVLVSGDGRWLGAVVGALLPGGRAPLRTMRLVLGVMACGPTQLAVAAVALCLAPDVLAASIPPAILLGAVAIEVTAPLRHRMATRLEEEM